MEAGAPGRSWRGSGNVWVRGRQGVSVAQALSGCGSLVQDWWWGRKARVLFLRDSSVEWPAHTLTLVQRQQAAPPPLLKEHRPYLHEDLSPLCLCSTRRASHLMMPSRKIGRWVLAPGVMEQGGLPQEEGLVEPNLLSSLPTETRKAVGVCPGAGLATLSPCHLAADCPNPVPGPQLPDSIHQLPEPACTGCLC